MAKYKEDAKKLLDLVGGAQNIDSVAHCATRMRFVLDDPTKANVKSIEDLSSVKGTFTQAGQFQVIIGNDVQDFYNDFVEVSGISGVSKAAAKSNAAKKMNPVQRAMNVLAEVFSPLIPAIIVGGLILGFRNVIGDIDLINTPDGKITIIESSVFWNGVYNFLWLIGEAIFQFLPVGITWSISKKMGTTEILGIVLGITLVSPQLLNAYAVASTPAADIPFWDFGFAQVNMIGYQAQVIPAMLAGFTLCYLEKFFRKIIPSAISMIFVPLFSLVPTVILANTVLGPVGWKIGSVISSVVYSGLTGSFKIGFGFLFGLLYAPLVITGLHHMTNAIDSQLVADFGGTMLWPMIALSNIAQGSAVLAIVFLHRGNKKEEQVSIPATISAYLGVTEPAMFGINIKYLYPFVASMIGSAFAGIISVGTGVMALSVGVGGLPGILSIDPKFYLKFLLAMLVAVVVPFVLTIVFNKIGLFNKEEVNDAVVEAYDEKEFSHAAPSGGIEKISAPVKGKLIAMEDVDDEVFSSKMMGDGFAVLPENGEIYSPVSGKIVSLFPTQHAITIRSLDGVEILLHMGLDTVELNGDPFKTAVKEGDMVNVNTLLSTMDLEKVKAAGKKTDVVVVVTNIDDLTGYQLEIDKVGTTVSPGQEVATTSMGLVQV